MEQDGGTKTPSGLGLDVPAAAEAVLDDPVRAALTGPHAHLAAQCGHALRYRADVSVWASLPAEPKATHWADLAQLVPLTESVSFAGAPGEVPQGWRVRRLPGVQMVDDGAWARHDEEAVRLAAEDIPEMLDLVERTKPGPFRPGTLLMGTYLGLRRDGALVAMAGERVRPPGWTEVSAVCTDPRFRGHGFASRLVGAVVAGIRERGERPYLGAARENTTAIQLYERLGFRVRTELDFVRVERSR